MLKLLILLILGATSASAQLAVSWGSSCLQSVTYNGVTLVDLTAHPGDGYSVRHMLLMTPGGAVDNTSGYNYGDGGYTSRTCTANGANGGQYVTVYPWGTLTTTLTWTSTQLNWSTTVLNNSSDPDTFYGAAVYLSNFRFPALPGQVTPGDWGSANAVELSFETLDFGVMRADWGTGLADHVDLNPAQAQYTGWLNDGSGSPNFYPVQSTTFPDGVPTFEPHYSLPVAPGASITYGSSIRFAASGTSRGTVDADVYNAVKTARPFALSNLYDRRMVLSSYLSSNGTGGGQIGPNPPSGCTSGPNYWNYLGVGGALDCTLDPYSTAFQTIVLNHAFGCVTQAYLNGAQGCITWDLEGQQYTQPSSYVCSPDQIATVAPPMEATIAGQTGALAAYNGMKLDDAYFKIQTDAGLKVGVCIRPQQFTIASGGATANQVYLSDADALTLLKSKAQFAATRWGATMFYMDTFVHADGGYIDTPVLAGLNATFPDAQFFPEYQFGASLAGYLQYSRPLASFIFHTDLGTAVDFPEAQWVYPKAAMINIINDVNSSTLATYQSQLQNAINGGDIMILRDFNQGNNATIQVMLNKVPHPFNALLLAQ